MTKPALIAGSPQRRVLLVDDEVLVLRSLTRMLRREFDLVTATDSLEAFSRLAVDLYAIVTDHDLGAGPDGRAVLAEARLRAPEARRILMSGRPQIPRPGEESLWDAFLQKPVSRMVLLAALGSRP